VLLVSYLEARGWKSACFCENNKLPQRPFKEQDKRCFLEKLALYGKLTKPRPIKKLVLSRDKGTGYLPLFG
jgi:hypothetical protein